MSNKSTSLPLAEQKVLELVPLAKLKAYPSNARTHTKKQIRQIAASIKRFGFTNPVLVDDSDQIVAGHGRAAAAKLLEISDIPVLRLSHLSDAEKRAYVLADNKLAENAGWDREILAIELQALIAIDFEVELTGFETAEIDVLLDHDNTGPSAEDTFPSMSLAGASISRPGDLWVLGGHRLFCGNALQASSYDLLLQGERAQMTITDPPYNVRIDGLVPRTVHHREFPMASGEMSEAEFVHFLQTSLGHIVANSEDGALAYVFMDWRHSWELLSAGRGCFSELKNIAVWNKNVGGMGSFYRSKHELIFIWKCGTAPHINNFGLGQNGRSRTNVWDYPTPEPSREGPAVHPTVKPVALIADALKDCSHRGGIILDAFAGSGTTLIAAERTGRRARAIELDPGYVDVAVRRWQAYSGKSAVLSGTNMTFEDVEGQRQHAVPLIAPPSIISTEVENRQ
jgi:DNA modification methylase